MTKRKTPVGAVSRVNTADERVTDYTEGGLRETGSDLDVALSGNGFFAVQADSGVVYTRNGSFNLDDEGYLILAGIGRVLGTDGPIRLTTDKISVDGHGTILDRTTRTNVAQLQIVDFADYRQLTKVTGGVFRANGQPQAAADVKVTQKWVEDSNVSMMNEMTAMITGQRSLQSASQILKMYDQLIDRAVQLGSM